MSSGTNGVESKSDGRQSFRQGGIMALSDAEEISQGRLYSSNGGVHQGKLDY